MAHIGVIGAGTWGAALSALLANAGHEVELWSAIPAEVDAMVATRTHGNLPGFEFPEGVSFTKSLEEAMAGKKMLVLAVPSIYTRETARKMRDFYNGSIIVSVAKGIEDATLKTLVEVIEDEIPGAVAAALSGPSHAEEVAKGLPTTCVAAARTKEVAQTIQAAFMGPVFRVYTSPDVLGVELGAALKNVIALAAGIADGLGYGDNTKAALITRGIAEIGKLAVKMGAHFQTVCGLSGIGDLIVTCASMHSRNRRAGILIGQGHSYEEAMKEVNMVVEGVYSAKAALALGRKYDVCLPIIEQVNGVLFDGKDPRAAVAELMMRDPTIESAGLPWG
ncbi:MAG: NAD(P)-dependent glycerol-3-phosphate dehydrogenase [Lachnospiraceae bacterium]|jgi:glycerol-3-phosphate dehydrogenase (NAD(P)+)|nr:NAD(P)-dependent glycerol-3-phosphate dehydrogenase [Lachnospiraceae bacterium]